jgi:hypothetical protein
MLSVLSFTIMNFQLETHLQKMAYTRVNYALKHAVHDAALFVDEAKLAEGSIIFNSIVGKQMFVETLKRNLPINDQLEPLHYTLFTEPITILEAIYIDDLFIDSNTGNVVEFPFIYEYNSTILNIEFSRPIFGPSVVYVVETKVHKAEKKHQFVTIQEYKR